MGDIADYYRLQQMDDEWNDQNLKKTKPLLHRCKDGRIVDVRGISTEHPKMDDQHLINTINYIKKRAKEGVQIQIGGGSTHEDFWFEDDWLYGKQAKKHLKYKKYKKEAIKRGLL